jgi:hypothetical protein
MTLSMSDTQHNNPIHCGHYYYAECRGLFTIMLSVIMLNVVMPSVVAPNNQLCFFLVKPFSLPQYSRGRSNIISFITFEFAQKCLLLVGLASPV